MSPFNKLLCKSLSKMLTFALPPILGFIPFNFPTYSYLENFRTYSYFIRFRTYSYFIRFRTYSYSYVFELIPTSYGFELIPTHTFSNLFLLHTVSNLFLLHFLAYSYSIFELIPHLQRHDSFKFVDNKTNITVIGAIN